MLAPSIVAPQNQYFPANVERMDEYCLGFEPLGPRDQALGCKVPALGKSLGPRGMYFPPLNRNLTADLPEGETET